jgi:acyl-CoA reductase-like NAD-dependent aldehyde dehydrogenase
MNALAGIDGKIYIGGIWRSYDRTVAVASPFDGHLIGSAAWAGGEQAREAIDAASGAVAKPLPAHQRARILQEAARILRERREEVARIVTLESGKPITASLPEIDRAEQTLLFSATAARTLHGEMVALDAHPAGEGRLGMTLQFPLGVVAAITPFNFPINLVCHKVGPALAAGCACVLKPADKTPLSALRLTQIFEEAGLPPGFLNTVTGDPLEISSAFLEDDRVKAISFTGSAAIGWSLRERAPRKKILLELGSATPLIVCADADLAAAAQAIVAGGYFFSGQACISVQRVYVVDAVYDQLVELLVPAVRALRVGNPLDPSTQIGPVINQASCDRIVSWVREAEQQGATILTGPITANGNMLEPVLIGDATLDMSVVCREIFGPVVSLSRIGSLEEAVAAANATPFGLQAGIFTRDIAAALRAVPHLDFGGILINESPAFRADNMPYGGNKDSGNTREGPAYAVEEFSQYRTVVIRYGG